MKNFKGTNRELIAEVYNAITEEFQYHSGVDVEFYPTTIVISEHYGLFGWCDIEPLCDIVKKFNKMYKNARVLLTTHCSKFVIVSKVNN